MSSANQYNLLNQMIGYNSDNSGNSGNNYNNYPIYSGYSGCSGYSRNSGQSIPKSMCVYNGNDNISHNSVGSIGGSSKR